MKTTILIVGTMLLFSCSKPSESPPATAPKLEYEYDVRQVDVSGTGDAIAKAELNLAVAQNEKAHADANLESTIGQITKDQEKNTNADSDVGFDVKKDKIESDRVEFLKTNLLAEINSSLEEGWELISIVPTGAPGKYLAVIKRPKSAP